VNDYFVKCRVCCYLLQSRASLLHVVVLRMLGRSWLDLVVLKALYRSGQMLYKVGSIAGSCWTKNQVYCRTTRRKKK
jgi:hypothetical protein